MMQSIPSKTSKEKRWRLCSYHCIFYKVICPKLWKHSRRNYRGNRGNRYRTIEHFLQRNPSGCLFASRGMGRHAFGNKLFRMCNFGYGRCGRNWLCDLQFPARVRLWHCRGSDFAGIFGCLCNRTDVCLHQKTVQSLSSQLFLLLVVRFYERLFLCPENRGGKSKLFNNNKF